ncbi:glucose-6-phosphate dehydrogenase [Parvularcula dongshanensis]|uniref:Glucose-6-phosphate 1-dehydrogenase n=1 Tax=Parvularcula dongshanensis TaxID=1173995 RepID=A0A840I114_9PROT|nr:glucose-6-phosphate dehydrogenase [Parvularcula dongshanensis]MBB4658427.1 glucose-6-phosphate 1-dehydrogenase [Parvularcula dongshanensis]
MSTACTFVLFGATGDLARRMLFPSLYFLHLEGFLAEEQKIVATSRSEREDAEFREAVREWVQERAGDRYDPDVFDAFAQRISYVSVDASEPQSFENLAQHLKAYCQDEIVFYLSTSPSIFGAVCQGLKANGLSKAPNRIVVEKPIGSDLASNIEINETVAEAFSEDRTFRIDHYLGKETVQNLIALRFGNRIFEPLWNAQAIESVQITIAETVGAEGRGGYYDEYGAIRDMVQNHLLQLVCLVAMEPPTSLSADSVRNEKVKVLKSLAPITPENVEHKTVRGQYEGGYAEQGAPASSYKEDVENEDSDTESYVAIAAEVENWRWAGVPFYLETGKRMAERNTQIVIRFREVPHSIFGAETNPNELIINLQPEERITLQIMNKKPGLTAEGMPLQELGLNLSLAEHHTARRRIAYEQLILDALNDNPALFVQRDEQEAAWRWIDGIIDAWQARGMRPKSYRSGGTGPSSKHSLTERNGHSWYE